MEESYDKSPSTLILPLITESEIPSVPLVALMLVPAIADTKSAILSFLVAVPSINGILSAVTSTVAAVNSFKSNASDTVPDVPPPDKPSPAVTPSMSPASFVKDITPVEESYDMSPDALSFPLITESAIPNVPELAVKFVPIIPDTKSAILSFLVAVPSMNGILSLATSTVAAINSFRSSASDTVPLVPPPERPSPAVTPSMSPTSASLVIVKVPAESS